MNGVWAKYVTKVSEVFRKSQSFLFLHFFNVYIIALLIIQIFLPDPFLGITQSVHCSQKIHFPYHLIFIQSAWNSGLGY